MAGCGGYVPAAATKWGNWNMDAEVRLIMRPGEAVIEESRSEEDVHHLRLMALLHELVREKWNRGRRRRWT